MGASEEGGGGGGGVVSTEQVKLWRETFRWKTGSPLSGRVVSDLPQPDQEGLQRFPGKDHGLDQSGVLSFEE